MIAASTPEPRATSGSWLASGRFVIAVLVVAAVLRIALAWQGGQYFFGDEARYNRGVELYLAVRAGDFKAAFEHAMLPEHMLFTWMGALVTAGQHLLAQLTAQGNWTAHPVYVTFTMGIGAAILSLFSTLNLALTYRLARALGADAREAGWALLLMAAANTAFYHARHLLPYDCALSFALLALVVGLGGNTPWRAWAGGFLAAVAYGIYNGYWYLVPVIWVLHGLAVRRFPRARVLILCCATGTAIGLAVPHVFGTLIGGNYYWAVWRDFSGSARQGSFAEGWSLPWEYLWHSEGPPGLGVAALTLLALAIQLRQHRPLETRVRLVLIGLALSYGLLVLSSSGLHVFVVYGRSVKPFVPFICLIGAWAVTKLCAQRSHLELVLTIFIAATAALHFWPHFPRVFPREVELTVLRHWGNPKHSISVSGSIYLPLALPVSRPDLALINAQFLYPAHYYLGYPMGKTLLRFTHPLTYLPFQYESHHPRERELLRTHDISIRLIALADPAGFPDDLPSPLRAQPLIAPKAK